MSGKLKLKKEIWVISMKNGDVFWVLDDSESIKEFTEVLFGNYKHNELNLREFKLDSGTNIMINVGCISSYNKMEVEK